MSALIPRLVLLSLLPLLASSGRDLVFPGPEVPVPASYFGYHAHRLGAGTAWPDATFGSYRAWDARVRWAELEPAPGQWQWQRLDALVEGARQRGQSLLLPLGMPPAWASARPQEISAYGAGEAAPPARAADWERYVAAVATRYRGRVREYEIWNEPNLPGFFSGSAAEMAELTCRARAVLRRIDPGIALVSPSATGTHGLDWLDSFLGAGGGACIDVLGYHFYNAHRDPESHLPLWQRLHALLAARGLQRLPVWNTETGWLIADGDEAVNAVAANFRLGDRVLRGGQAADVVARALLLHWVMGGERFYWYALDNGAMGLLDPAGQPRPALVAYRQMQQLLQGRRVSGCRLARGVRWSCDILQGGRPLARVLWSTAATPLELPLPAGVEHLERIGTVGRQPPGGALRLDATLVVLWWAAGAEGGAP